ncbi:MAG: M16 family metallopeptidase [Vulcanimicrobiota bacterium]
MVKSTVLENGLQIVTERIPEFRSCTLGIWIGTGSRHEQESEAGTSHFLEHLLFKGTSTRSAYDIAKTMDGVGGQLNAFTEKERTCYYARVMADHVTLAVDLLVDMVAHSLLDPAEVEREKGVILEEIKMFEDSPDDQVAHHFTRRVWARHALGRPIIGTRQVVAGMSRELLLEYMQRRYRTSNIMVAAAGQVDHDLLVGEVKRRSDQLLQGATSQTLTPPASSRRSVVYFKDCEQVYVCYGCPGLSAIDPRRYQMMVLDSVLGGSMSSRLFQEIREKRGLVYSVGTFQNSYRDCGLFGIYAGTGSDRVEQVIDITRDILTDIRNHGITDEELSRAKELLKGNLALAMESTSARMLRLARSVFYHGRLVPIGEVLSEVEKTDHENIRALADWLLDIDNYSLAVLGPVESVDGISAQPVESLSSVDQAAFCGGRS